MDDGALQTLAKNLVDIGAVSLEQYLADDGPAPPQQLRLLPVHPAPDSESTADANAVTHLHQACQRTLRSTDALKFEFVEHSGSRNKQCILTITRPDGTRRSYATLPVFAKKSEAKMGAAKIAIDMGALDFLAGAPRPPSEPTETASADDAPDASSAHPTAAHDAPADDIERCCLEWHAGRVTPHWIPFSDPKSAYKQGCALRIQLSPHVVRVYLVDPTFDAFLDAKGACAAAAVQEDVLGFIKHGNGQSRPSSPVPTTFSTPSVPLPVAPTTPWTLQAFYESLPRPFPESFDSSEVTEINAPAWLNTLVQNARGGKLVLSFFFTSDGSPGLHGCLLRLDRPGEYKASLVDARFPKRSDAKAAVCLQAMSQGIGDYIRSIASAVDTRITHTMRSFASSLVYPALMSELSKIGSNLHPHVEYDKERDAFGATLVVRLSTSPASEQVRRYTVSSEYRNKADAKVGVVCHAAEHGVIEFVRFRGGNPPDGYVSHHTLKAYNPDTSRKRKQSGSADDAGQGPPAKKKRKKGKQRAEAPSHGEGSHLTSVGQSLPIHPSGNQMHIISGPGDMGLLQSVPMDRLYDPSRPGFGGVGGSGAALPAVYGHGPSYDARTYASACPTTLDPRFAGSGGLDSRMHGVYPVVDGYNDGLHPAHPVDVSSSAAGPSRARSTEDLPHSLHHPVDSVELEPGEVVSSAESEFSESSSRNEDVDGVLPANKQETDVIGKESVDAEHAAQGSRNKGKGKETSPTGTSPTVARDSPGAAITNTSTTSHVKKLIDYCTQRGCDSPSFHETQCQGQFQVWIIIGKERFDLPTTYASAEEGRQRVARQVLARFSKGSSG